jgi:SAM-dependent methyltransferase
MLNNIKKKLVKNKLIRLAYRLICPLIDPVRLTRSIIGYIDYIKTLYKYSKVEPIKFIDLYPCVLDKTKTSSFDSHYFYQDIWAFKKIYISKTPVHIDIGSRVDFVGFLSSITNVIFVDIRPLIVSLDQFKSIYGNILSLPFEDDSIYSLSCLHVAEHIGLGRYGDPIDKDGTMKACKELARVLAPNGNLLFSMPIGKPRVCFNAHRIFSIEKVLEFFDDLKLVELSGIDDNGNFFKNVDLTFFEKAEYSCGLFHFTKRH